MQYQVPQFIEIEDKIFGPLTFKQFAYVAGGGAMCFVAYRFLPFLLSVPIILVLGGFSLALAFYKVNNRPFIFMVESAVRFFLSNKLYLWQKEEKKPGEIKKLAKTSQTVAIPKLSGSRLKELTWSLDINNSVYQKTNEAQAAKLEETLGAFHGLSNDMPSTSQK